MDFTLVSDKKGVIGIIDNSNEITKLTFNILKQWDALISKIIENNINKKAIEIFQAKKSGNTNNSDELLMKEAIKAAVNQPDVHKFRLVLDLSYDANKPGSVLEDYAKLIKGAMDQINNPKGIRTSGWENFKRSEKSS